MRHKGVDKEETRQKMLAGVGRGFRRHGYAGIGVDGLASEAGVTSGAFYAHLGSKKEAFELALDAGLDEVIEAIPKFQTEYRAGWVTAFVDYYLGRPHRKDLDCGCAMASLTSEVVRFGSDVHKTYEKKMTRIADLIAAGLIGDSESGRHARAWSMLGILIGGLNVVRAMKSVKMSEEISEAIKISAIQVAGPAHGVV